jgi:predicted Zn-dependent peptidase
MNILPTPKGKYVLFQAFKNYDELVYGILERDEFFLEKMSDRDALYTYVAIGDDKKSLERILKELNSLKNSLEFADKVIEGYVTNKNK